MPPSGNLEIVRDGEGTSRVVTVRVRGARSKRDAESAARAIANFNRAYWRMLLRMYGWGRAA